MPKNILKFILYLLIGAIPILVVLSLYPSKNDDRKDVMGPANNTVYWYTETDTESGNRTVGAVGMWLMHESELPAFLGRITMRMGERIIPRKVDIGKAIKDCPMGSFTDHLEGTCWDGNGSEYTLPEPKELKWRRGPEMHDEVTKRWEKALEEYPELLK